MNSLQANAIILGTMAEIVAIIGFLIAALGGVKSDMFTFGAVAADSFSYKFSQKEYLVKNNCKFRKHLEEFNEKTFNYRNS